MKKEKENFIKKFRYMMIAMIMAGIFLTACAQPEVQPEPQTEIQIQPEPQTEIQIQPESGSNSWAQAYLLLIEEMIREMREDGYTALEIHYSLIYLDDDDIPELVYGPDGYWVSVYTWQDGQIYTVMDREAYGTWGRVYSYEPFQSIVCTECYSFGDTDNGFYMGRYWDFYQMAETTYELEYLYGLSWVETRENRTDEDVTIAYYYEEPDMTEREITEEEFDAYDVTNAELYTEDDPKYIFLKGYSSAYEIINELMRSEQTGWQPRYDEKEMLVPAEITLLDITWDDYNSESYDTWLHFSFSDGTVVDKELPYSPSMVEKIDFMDITGDGVNEALVYRYFANTATEYTLINFFQIEENIVTEISPELALEELADDVWSVIDADFSGKEYDIPVFTIESYAKENMIAYVDKRLLVGYREGGWQILEWISEL